MSCIQVVPSSILGADAYYEVIKFDPFAKVRGDVGNPGKGCMCLHVGGIRFVGSRWQNFDRLLH